MIPFGPEENHPADCWCQRQEAKVKEQSKIEEQKEEDLPFLPELVEDSQRLEMFSSLHPEVEDEEIEGKEPPQFDIMVGLHVDCSHSCPFWKFWLLHLSTISITIGLDHGWADDIILQLRIGIIKCVIKCVVASCYTTPSTPHTTPRLSFSFSFSSGRSKALVRNSSATQKKNGW